MNQEQFLEELRELYRENKMQELRNRYAMGSWMLSQEQRDKIESVLGHVLPKKSSLPGEQKSLLEEAQDLMGGEISKI